MIKEQRTMNNEPRTMSDFESLKQSAKDRIAEGDLVGINPHKVLRLCIEFEELKKTGRQPELSETPVINGEQATAPVQEGGELSEGTRARAIRSLSWLVEDAKHRFDDCKNNLENGSTGGYSPELTEAIELLDELRKGMSSPDKNELVTAYHAGFEDAKKVILQEVQKLGK